MPTLAVILCLTAVPVVLLAQPDPGVVSGSGALQTIPAPPLLTIRPRMFAAYGALIAGAMLSILYLYRGRAFVVYWIGGWLLIAASLVLGARGYADVRLGSVMLGCAELLSVWSAGLTLLAAEAFPDAPLRWDAPIKTAAATAVWFLAAPFVLPLTAVLATGPALAAILFGWAALRYLRLMRATRYIGAFLIGAGLAAMTISNAAAAGVVINFEWSAAAVNRLLALNIVVYMFVALGMHVLIFEDMTDELRRTNRSLEAANAEVKRLAITDPLTGCHNRRFFDEIERREIQRHRRYGSPLSLVFVDVDQFKRLNDTFGHDVGDRVLRTLGAILRQHVRGSDYVIRWGGDEFLLLLTCTVPEAERKAAELKEAFRREAAATGLPEGVGLSTGVAGVRSNAERLAEAIRDADNRMYREKLADRAGS